MVKTLIVSDSQTTAIAIEAAFTNASWSNKSIGVLAMMGRDSSSARHHQCVVLVVDIEFCKRFGSVLEEMSAIIQNHSKHTSFYLMFEGHYDPVFSTWLEHAKRSFASTLNQENLRDTIKEIIQLESSRFR